MKCALLFAFCFFFLKTALCKDFFSFVTQANTKVTIGLIAHPKNPEKNIQFHLLTPNTEGPFPLVVYLHDGQLAAGILGSRNTSSFFQKWLDKNMAVLIPTFPGFGFSDGPCDYCGDFTISALSHVIDIIKKQTCFKKQKTALCGFSHGAIAAILLSTIRSDIDCTVAASGVYDLEDAFHHNLQFKWNLANGKFFPLTEEEIHKRSSYFLLDTIKIPILFLHAEDDPYISVVQSTRAYQRVKVNNKYTSLCVIKQASHHISEKFSHPPILRFLEEHLLQD